MTTGYEQCRCCHWVNECAAGNTRTAKYNHASFTKPTTTYMLLHSIRLTNGVAGKLHTRAPWP